MKTGSFTPIQLPLVTITPQPQTSVSTEEKHTGKKGAAELQTATHERTDELKSVSFDTKSLHGKRIQIVLPAKTSDMLKISDQPLSQGGHIDS
jgi:hypothetical protein